MMIMLVVTLAVTIVLAIPLGLWMKKVMCGEVAWVNTTEHWILSTIGFSSKETGWKPYLMAVLVFSVIGFAVLWIMLLFQGYCWDAALNTAVSFVSNTNWQSLDPTLTLSWPVQVLGLSVQNFVSAAVGICVLFALVRGFLQVQNQKIGCFWKDMIGILLFVLIPLNLVVGIALAGCGVPMNFTDTKTSALLEPVAVDEQGQIIQDAQVKNGEVYVDGQQVDNAYVITEQMIPSGLMASQEAIKQSGTNGGGYTLASSASPYENPNAFSNLIENVCILLIPMALCFSFGSMVKDRKQGIALFAAMLILFLIALAGVLIPELQAMNMEGKEARLGIVSSSLWTVSTTAASNGSVNSALNSLTPFGSMVAMILMEIGEVVFGGAGTGLIGMIGFVVLTVFMAGLMVGRTPEFLGKKIEVHEMKMTVVLCLCGPLCILLGSALGCFASWPGLSQGAHGFSQLLYAFSSTGANNGSAMAGFDTSTIFMNVCSAVLMACGRFVPIAAALSMAGSLAVKKKVPSSAGTLSTKNVQFVFLLIFVILLVGALSFFPALALGPIAEILG